MCNEVQEGEMNTNQVCVQKRLFSVGQVGLDSQGQVAASSPAFSMFVHRERKKGSRYP